MNPDFVQADLKEVEEEYWHLITESDSHVQVQQESIDALVQMTIGVENL